MLPYFELGSTTPDYTCSDFDSIRREVAQTMTGFDDVTLADMARVDLIELFHPDSNVLSLEAVTWDGRVVGTWGEKPERPIGEYMRFEQMEAAQ